MNITIKRLKLAVKHLLGKDLYLKPDQRTATRFYGSPYGGWALPEGVVNAGSIIYSFGIGEDVSFDLALIEATGCRVFGFDPTPKSLRWVEGNVREHKFVIRPWALGASDGELQLWLPKNPEHVSASCRPSEATSHDSFVAECRSLESVMRELDHAKVDVLKMDIEGHECEAVIGFEPVISNIKSIIIEIHTKMILDSYGEQKLDRMLAALETYPIVIDMKNGKRLNSVSKKAKSKGRRQFFLSR